MQRRDIRDNIDSAKGLPDKTIHSCIEKDKKPHATLQQICP